jgi:integrase
MEKDKMYVQLTSEWIKEHRRFIKESTYSNYKNIIDTHLDVDFCDFKLRDFNNTVIQDYVLEKLNNGSSNGKGLKTKSVRDLLVVLKMTLRYGFSKGDMEAFDLSVKFPKNISNKRPAFIRNDEIKKIVKLVTSSRDTRCIGILISLLTGLRIGEICALRFHDINLSTGTINVSRTLQRIYTRDAKSKIIETTPKTSSSFREVPIPKELFKYFVYYNDADHFILSRSFKPVEPRVMRRVFTELLKDNKIKHYSFHSLRHTFASKCIEAEIDYKTVSEILGHSNINTTLNLYVHPNQRQKENAINKLSAFIGTN